MDESAKKSTKKKCNGEGSVFKTGDRWVAQIQTGTSKTGMIRKKFTGKTRKDVVKKLEDYKLIASKVDGTIKQTKLEDFIAVWFNEVHCKKLKQGSQTAARSTINTYIIPRLGHYKMMELSSEIIQKELISYMEEVICPQTKRKLSYSTINHAYVYLHACLDYACKNRKIPYNPADNITLPKELKKKTKPQRFLTDEEVDRFMQAVDTMNGKNYLYKHREIYLLSLYTGARVGEIIGLRWKDVDFENKRIYICGNVIQTGNGKPDERGIEKRVSIRQDSTKGGKDRYVPLSDIALGYVNQLKDRYYKGDDDVYMTTGTTKPCDYECVKKGYMRVCKRANISNPSGLHALRHTFASKLFRQNVDAKVISEILGHTTVAYTMQTYVHVIDEQKQKSVALIDYGKK